MTTCSTIGAELRPGDGCFEVWNTEARTHIGEIHCAEGHGYSAWFLTMDRTMESCGEWTHLCRAIQEVRDRRFQTASAWVRSRKEAS